MLYLQHINIYHQVPLSLFVPNSSSRSIESLALAPVSAESLQFNAVFEPMHVNAQQQLKQQLTASSCCCFQQQRREQTARCCLADCSPSLPDLLHHLVIV